MKRLPIYVCKAFAYVAVLYLLFQLSDYLRTKSVESQLTNFETAQDIYGKSISLSANNSNDIWFLYFWATWCSPCKATSVSMNALANDHTVVSVALASGSNQDLRNYQNKAKLSFPVINDEEVQLAGAMNIQATPTILLMKGNEVVDKMVGISTYPGLVLRKAQASLLRQ